MLIPHDGRLLGQHIECARLGIAGPTQVEREIRVGSSYHVGILQSTPDLSESGADFEFLLMRFLMLRGRAIFNIRAIFRRQEALDTGGFVGELNQRDLSCDGAATECGDDGVDP